MPLSDAAICAPDKRDREDAHVEDGADGAVVGTSSSGSCSTGDGAGPKVRKVSTSIGDLSLDMLQKKVTGEVRALAPRVAEFSTRVNLHGVPRHSG